jgi:hypothetical protein
MSEFEVANDPRLVVNQRTISRWELGETQPLGIHRPQLVAVLHVPRYHDLFIPEEVASQVKGEASQLLLTAHRISRGGNSHWIATHDGNHHVAVELGWLWLAQPDSRHSHWKLTGSGEDVLEVLRAKELE